MNKNKINVAIIGCGRIAGHHCRSIKNIEGFNLVAVCDLVIEKANTFANEFNIQAYDNYKKMFFDNPNINLVVIATPSGMHFEHTIDIIKNHKKHIIVEKPTFMKPSQVKKAYEIAKNYNLEIFPIFQNRYNSAVQRVLSAISNNELGKIFCASVRVRWCRPQRYYDLAAWRGTFSMDGGSLTNQGIHHIDLLRKLVGEVKKVSSVHQTFGADIEVEDTAVAVFEFENKAIGSLEITTAARPDDFEASISLVCEKGLAQIGGIAVNELQIFTPNPEDCLKHSEDFSGNVYGNGHSKIYKDIYSYFDSKNPYPIDYLDTFNSIKLLNSFYISNENRKWVYLNQSMDSSKLGIDNKNLQDMYITK
tara:strand:+ start:161 stop:1249 length:1089 start_codon:yes stop_codon:yes gene_type:complete